MPSANKKTPSAFISFLFVLMMLLIHTVDMVLTRERFWYPLLRYTGPQ